MWKDLKLPDGRDRVVRHGHGPHRAIQTGVGPVEVRRAKVRDRGEVRVTGGERTGGDLGGARETDCVPGHIGLEPPNPSAQYLIEFL